MNNIRIVNYDDLNQYFNYTLSLMNNNTLDDTITNNLIALLNNDKNIELNNEQILELHHDIVLDGFDFNKFYKYHILKLFFTSPFISDENKFELFNELIEQKKDYRTDESFSYFSKYNLDVFFNDIVPYFEKESSYKEYFKLLKKSLKNNNLDFAIDTKEKFDSPYKKLIPFSIFLSEYKGNKFPFKDEIIKLLEKLLVEFRSLAKHDKKPNFSLTHFDNLISTKVFQENIDENIFQLLTDLSTEFIIKSLDMRNLKNISIKNDKYQKTLQYSIKKDQQNDVLYDEYFLSPNMDNSSRWQKKVFDSIKIQDNVQRYELTGIGAFIQYLTKDETIDPFLVEMFLQESNFKKSKYDLFSIFRKEFKNHNIQNFDLTKFDNTAHILNFMWGKNNFNINELKIIFESFRNDVLRAANENKKNEHKIEYVFFEFCKKLLENVYLMEKLFFKEEFNFINTIKNEMKMMNIFNNVPESSSNSYEDYIRKFKISDNFHINLDVFKYFDVEFQNFYIENLIQFSKDIGNTIFNSNKIEEYILVTKDPKILEFLDNFKFEFKSDEKQFELYKIMINNLSILKELKKEVEMVVDNKLLFPELQF